MTTTMNPTEMPVIVLVERECAGDHDPALRHIAPVAGDKHIHLVAPARQVDGEHWLVDVDAREQDANERLASWSAALAPYASSINGEIGDENSRLALADARREVGRDARVLSVSASTGSLAAPRAVPARAPLGVGRMASRLLAA
jgi:hypothetical protein